MCAQSGCVFCARVARGASLGDVSVIADCFSCSNRWSQAAGATRVPNSGRGGGMFRHAARFSRPSSASPDKTRSNPALVSAGATCRVHKPDYACVRTVARGNSPACWADIGTEPRFTPTACLPRPMKVLRPSQRPQPVVRQAATRSYSWTMPPRTSLRWTVPPWPCSERGSGTASCRPRCGRAWL